MIDHARSTAKQSFFSTVELQTVTDFILDGTHGSPEHTADGVPLLSAKNVHDGNLEFDVFDYVSKQEYDSFRHRLHIVPSDVVLTIVGSIGRTAVVETTRPFVLLRSVAVIRPKKEMMDPRYLRWVLESPRMQERLHLLTKQGSQPGVYLGEVRQLAVPLCDLGTQQRIVAKLDEQMAALDRAEKALAEQQAAALAFKRATLQTALDQAIHPEWECATLMDLCTFANGLWTGKKPPFQQASVIRNTNFTRDCTLDFSDIAHLDVEERQLRSRRLRTGDIILERSGGGPKQPVGRVALFELNDEFYSFSNFTSVIRMNERNGVLPRFLWYYLFHLYSSGVTEALQNHTSGIRNLDFSSYVMLSIPVPTLDEQRRVVEQLDWSIEQANNLLSYVAEQALTLASLRTSLLDAAFSGEISHD